MNNYHTHTRYCDGKDTPKELAEAAIRLGCSALGFSGHGFTHFDTSWCMSPEGTEAYVRELRELKQVCGGRLDILIGLERDYYGANDGMDWDYTIGSVHYVNHNGEYLPVDESEALLRSAVRRCYDGDIYAFIEAYYRCVGDIYEKTKCRIVGHFDLITKFNEGGKLFDEDHPRYLEAAGAALERLRGKPLLFELNTGAIARGYRSSPYPSPTLRRMILKQGGSFILSSDCHDKKDLLCGFEVPYPDISFVGAP